MERLYKNACLGDNGYCKPISGTRKAMETDILTFFVLMWLLFCSPYCSCSQVREKVATYLRAYEMNTGSINLLLPVLLA